MKLTQAQRELLIEVFNGEHHCVEAYRPAQQLVAKGLCEWTAPDRLATTPAGRLALQESKHD